ncbi:MAG: chaperonin family protein RbcX [Synechococcales cyanobacterium RM1_1_8]|nr:chaperonin family protein RbcX [Synechococcales cyanobacterium RM1_1_8]
MDLPRIAQETCNNLVHYLTYQACREIAAQLQETNPAEYIWLQQFTAQHSLQRSDEYLAMLYRQRPDLALRIMTVRTHLVEDFSDALPEMSRTSIHQANLKLRREMLEHLTQTSDASLEAGGGS